MHNEVAPAPAEAADVGPPANPAGVAPVIQVHVTRRCNLRCDHCYTGSGPEVRDQLPADLVLPALEDAVVLGYRQLALSGGEPLLYPALPRILEHAKRLGMLPTLTSNGTTATRPFWAACAGSLHLAAISIDGLPARHDQLRRRRGAFLETLGTLPLLRELGIPFAFLFTLTQYNADQLEFVVRLAAEQRAVAVQVHPMTSDGRAGVHLRDSTPDGREAGAALVEASLLARHYGVPVQVDVVTTDQLQDYRSRFVPRAPVRRLCAAAPLLVVTADATILPLTHGVGLDLALGSLLQAPLGQLAGAWLERGSGDVLARCCERAWTRLTRPGAAPAAYWYEAVAAETVAVTHTLPHPHFTSPTLQVGGDPIAAASLALEPQPQPQPQPQP